ncbi:hypothetical protein F4861DRAFT_313377 [Xylaria intraflava]|nr:hypothetical protein F4861DRAFT_313377 [Xylaria intraflava]
MADENAPRNIRVPDLDEVEQDDDDDDPSPPEDLARYLYKWRFWYNIIVHRRENIIPFRTCGYTLDYVTDEVRPAPFPFNLTETSYCGALLALTVTIHDGIHSGWLFGSGYPYILWVGRVVGRVLLTVGAAVLSTLGFEIVGGLATKIFQRFTAEFEDWLARLLIKRFDWGEVDADGEPMRDDDGDFIWLQDSTHRREAIRNSLQGMLILALDYLVMLLLASGNDLIQPFVERILGPSLYFFFSIPVNFIPGLLSHLVLPTPGHDDTQGARTLWFEYGVPIVLQFQVLVFFWLLKILYMAKAERLGLQGWRFTDPKMALVWQLIRATAMHLLAYTAYQLVCSIVTALKPVFPRGSKYKAFIDGPLVPFLRRIIPEGKFFAAALLFLFHWLFRVTSLISVRLARPLWMPYLLWQTRYSRAGAGECWPLFVESLEKDFTVLDSSKRVLSRVLMTALFGLKSSWPARFKLSGIVEDN